MKLSCPSLLVAGVASIAACQSQPQHPNSGHDVFVESPTICALVKSNQALVKGSIAQIGTKYNSPSQAGLIPPPDVNDSPLINQMTDLVLSVSTSIYGSLPSSAALGIVAYGTPTYFQGKGAGYWFLNRNNGHWVGASADSLFFEDSTGTLRNSGLYSEGITEQSFLSQVAAAQAGPCPTEGPVPICELQGNCDGGTLQTLGSSPAASDGGGGGVTDGGRR